MSKTSRSVLVKVLDTDDVLHEACKAGELELSKDEQRKVCFFLAQLIEKLWKKFEIEDIDIQFLLAKKVDLDIRISESHLEEFHKSDKHILEHFHSFRLKVNDIRSYISLEQKSVVKWKLLNYLEKDYTDEERAEWGRPLKESKQPPAQAGGLVLWTESPDTGPRPVVSSPCESCPRDSARSDVPDTL